MWHSIQNHRDISVKLLQTWMKLNLSVENEPIPISMITVLVLCISAMRSQQSRWLSRVETHGVKKKTPSKHWCCIRIEVTLTRQTFLHAHEDHSNTYKMIPGSRQYSQNHSCYKQMNTLQVYLLLCSIWCTRHNSLWD
jgi:hypothetical protein